MSIFQQLSQSIGLGHPSTIDRRQDIPITRDDVHNALEAFDQPNVDPFRILRNVQVTLSELVRNVMEIPEKIRNKMVEYKDSIIGVGFIRFAGPESADGAIDISGDLDSNVNPRDRSETHVQKIATSIRGKKYDWIHPIYLRVSQQLLDASLRAELGKIQPFQEFATPPLFHLNNVSPREQELSAELYWERSLESPYVYYSPAELQAKKKERDELRRQRPRASLVNGGHRVSAMQAVSEDFEPFRRRAITAEKCVVENPNDAQAIAEYKVATAELVAHLNEHTWQVIVFKDTTNPAVLNDLATNPDPLPVLPAGESEQMWMHVSGIKAELEVIQLAAPGLPRSEVMDRWWVNRLAASESKSKTGDDEEQQGEANAVQLQVANNKGKGKGREAGKEEDAAQPSKQKGGADGLAMHHRLTQVPVLLELLLANQQCIWPLTKMFSASSVGSMLQPHSGALVASFWMSCELLRRLGNSSGDAEFAAARELIAHTPKLRVAGFPSAVSVWRNLRQNPQRLPEALKEYNVDIAKQFEKIYGKRFGLKKVDDEDYLLRDWDNEETAIQLRAVIDEWGQGLENHSKPALAEMGLTARVYARLPAFDIASSQKKRLVDTGVTSEDFFHNRAVLPTPAIGMQWVRLVNQLSPPGAGRAGIDFLEYLLDRNKPMWSFAQGDNTRPAKNWYNSSRGTLQAVLQWVPEHSMGCIMARMSSLVSWLFHPHYFYRAFRFLDQAVSPIHRINDMRQTYGASKKKGLGTLSEGTLTQFQARFPATGLLSAEDILSALKDVAAHGLRQYLKEGSPADLPHLIETHPCLKVVSELYWGSAQIIWWNSAFESAYTSHCIIGWGLLMDAYESSVVENVILHRRVYHLINLASICSEAHGAWWGDSLSPENLRRARRRALNSTRELVPSDDESDSDPEDTDPHCKKVEFITSFVRAQEHVTPPHSKAIVQRVSAASSSKNSRPPANTERSDPPGVSSNPVATRLLGQGTASRPAPGLQNASTRVSSGGRGVSAQNYHQSTQERDMPNESPDFSTSRPDPAPSEQPSPQAGRNAAVGEMSLDPPTPEAASMRRSPSLLPFNMFFEQTIDTTQPLPPHIGRDDSPPRASSDKQSVYPPGRDASLPLPPSGQSLPLLRAARDFSPPPDRSSPFASPAKTPTPFNRDKSPPVTPSSTVARSQVFDPPLGSVTYVGQTQSSILDRDASDYLIVWSAPGVEGPELQIWFDPLETNQDPRDLAFMKEAGLNVEETQREIYEQLLVPGLIVNGFLSSRLLPGYDGQSYFQAFRSKQRVHSDIQAAFELTGKALTVAFQARRNFQLDILFTMRQSMAYTNSSSYLMENLAPGLYGLKLLYIKQLAISLSELGIPLEDAFAEAILMAASDKVFTSEIFEWRENGDVVVDFSTTFPRANMPLKGRAKLIVGNIERLNTCAMDKLGMLTATAVSQGPSESIAMMRATTAGPIHAFQISAFNEDACVTYSKASRTVPTPAIEDLAFDQGLAFQAIIHGPLSGEREPTHELAERLGMSLRSYGDGARTFQDPMSCLSGGNFLRPRPWHIVLRGMEEEEGESLRSMFIAESKLLRQRKQLDDRLYNEWNTLLQDNPDLVPQ
ncbi:hypothetical protein RSAG8_08816, partial [Rhizoctonia solani AG-8 WAC10335]